jgi:hypothetical protein
MTFGHLKGSQEDISVELRLEPSILRFRLSWPCVLMERGVEHPATDDCTWGVIMGGLNTP